MKKVLILAAAALALAACAKQQEIPAEETQPMAVGFDAYLNRAVTKAETDLAAIQATGKGFGIFAYYTDNEDYSGTSIPNFMYNQQVTYNSGASPAKWEYTPLKYWPNEYGDGAKSEETDRISFFAYAPYIAADIATGKVSDPTKKGIVGFTKNNYAGDPLVKYVVDLKPFSSVDLVWGRQPGDGSFKSYDGKDYTTAELKGFPWLNVRRPKYETKETVKFQFDHALASLNVQIDADPDIATHGTSALDKNTRIWIRSITFTGFATEGTLNLNNIEASKALWQSINGDDLVTGEEVTIFDGRKDGKEGTTTANNEKYQGLNPALIQSAGYATYDSSTGLTISSTVTGVTNTAVNLFDPDGVATADQLTAPVYVIPTGDAVTVTIAYDVETYDANLVTFLSDGTTHGSSISNVIMKNIPVTGTALKLENGKKYTLKLHLGMNSVKVDAVVTDWVDGATENVELPTN